MSYSKTDWTNNSAPAIKADNLNKIEQGIYDNDAAIASANTNIGTLTNLTTTEKSNLVGAINEVDSNTDINTNNIGDLSDLETTANTDLVSAINEVDSHADTNATNIGDLTTLTTTANTDLVSAVNELDDLKATKDVATTSANGLMSASDKTLLNNETTYSTTETRIGTWIDGKPLYRKVVYISSLPNNTMTTYQVFNDKSIIDTCFIDSSGSYMKIGQEVDTLNWIYSTTGFLMTCLVNKEIRIKTTDDKTTAHAYIAVCYTKTTD